MPQYNAIYRKPSCETFEKARDWSIFIGIFKKYELKEVIK